MGHGRSGNQTNNYYSSFIFSGRKCPPIGHARVDSTDPTHQQVTAEQLYTTDVIVYVTDYNHVQSETNLHFLRQLTSEQKPIFLVINQIDKHDEKELSLHAYENSIKTMLDRWNIHPVSIYYTSMKDLDHPANQIEVFNREMKALLYRGEEILSESLSRLAAGTAEALKSRIEEEIEEAKEEWEARLEENDIDPELIRKQESREHRLKTLDGEKKQAIKKLYDDRNSLFENVTLFPYSTTEKARNWLESQDPQFKVGVFFSKKKTEEERNQRLQALTEELNEKINTQLLFHIKNLLSNASREYLPDQAYYERQLEELEITVDQQWFAPYVTTQQMDRQFVYTFTKQITSDIVRTVKQKTDELFSLYEQGISKAYEREKEEIEGLVQQSASLDYEKQAWEEVQQGFENEIETVNEWLRRHNPASSLENKLKDLLQRGAPDAVNNIFSEVTMPDEGVIDQEEEETSFTSRIQEDLSWMVEPVSTYVSEYRDRSFLSSERRQLENFLTRYENQTFVISLFGAFSAGKSSFGNALLGDTVLPVSPHPTTATVNRVRKPDKEHSHGTVKVFVKSEEFLNNEIKKVARELEEDVQLKTLRSWDRSEKNITSTWKRTNIQYLKTLKRALEQSPWKLGEELTMPLPELHDLVAKEEKACLLQEVIVYYDCEWTKRGVELVDTPGVNSIHGRHTNVAFEQMRVSDAIFYLTYYNHAFSKADQYFLQQMGKVNETFEQDKLYFIINASDLANSPQELNGVKNHVKEQLKVNGLKEPRLFALSSKKGLEAKQKKEVLDQSSFGVFEDHFREHTIEELKHLNLLSIKGKAEEILNKIDDTLSGMAGDKEEKERQLARQTATIQRLGKEAENFSLQKGKGEVLRESEQQFAYLKERTAFVMNDYFPHVINSAVINGSTKKELRNQLDGAIYEFEGFIEQFLRQEIEASLIRLEQKLRREGEEGISEWMKQWRKELPFLSVSDKEWNEQSISLEHPSYLALDREKYAPYVKSKKDFFENQEIKRLKESLIEDGKEGAASKLATVEAKVKEELIDRVAQWEKNGQNRLKESLHQEKERLTWMMDTSMKPALEAEKEKLTSIFR